MRDRAGEVAGFLKALANENRLLILCVLLEGEQNVGQLNSRIDLSPSALSQHLGWLREAGFVQRGAKHKPSTTAWWMNVWLP